VIGGPFGVVLVLTALGLLWPLRHLWAFPVAVILLAILAGAL
jgi:hypothetical protein